MPYRARQGKVQPLMKTLRPLKGLSGNPTLILRGAGISRRGTIFPSAQWQKTKVGRPPGVSAALRYPENRSGLRCSSDSPTAAEIPQCLHLPPAAALRDSAHGRDFVGAPDFSFLHCAEGSVSSRTKTSPPRIYCLNEPGPGFPTITKKKWRFRGWTLRSSSSRLNS